MVKKWLQFPVSISFLFGSASNKWRWTINWWVCFQSLNVPQQNSSIFTRPHHIIGNNAILLNFIIENYKQSTPNLSNTASSVALFCFFVFWVTSNFWFTSQRSSITLIAPLINCTWTIKDQSKMWKPLFLQHFIVSYLLQLFNAFRKVQKN